MAATATPHYYRLRALSYNHRGGGFVLELFEQEEHYRLRYQNDADHPAHDRFRQGQIDTQTPFIEDHLAPEQLKALIYKMETLRIPLPPPLSGGFDGISQHLWIENGMSLLHLSWWLDCPELWQEIDDFWQTLMKFKPK